MLNIEQLKQMLEQYNSSTRVYIEMQLAEDLYLQRPALAVRKEQDESGEYVFLMSDSDTIEEDEVEGG